MKITTGIDIIEVERIKKAIEDLGDNFLNRIYTSSEIEYCNKSDIMKYQHYAARFAVKEAVYKAISNYVLDRDDGLWTSIEVINYESGKPGINVERLNKNITKTANDLNIKDIDISISHIKEYAIASAVAVFE
jgi:holo-[acyl-carrier protein] synthase